ncbi:MAG: hypothetical protein ACR2HR_04675 [Euzebya sp.]
MRHPLRSVLAAGALVMVAALPAAAAPTTVNFTVTANTAGLSISSAAASKNIANTVFAPTTAATITDTLPAITVTDQRGTLLGAWTVSVSGTAFTHTVDTSKTVANTNGRVYNAAADLTALTTSSTLSGTTVTGGELAVGTSNLGTAYTLLTGTTPTGNGTATATPSIAVNVPANTPAGTYSGTVTYTVA